MPQQSNRIRLNVVGRKDRDLRAYRMRRKGMDATQIGRELGLTTVEAKAACMRVLAEHAALSDEEIQAEKLLEVSRCELAAKTSFTLIGKFLPYASGEKVRHVKNSKGEMVELDEPDLDAANFIDKVHGTLMAIGKRKASLLGLDAPKDFPQVNNNQTINVNYVEQPIQRDGIGPTVTINAEPCPIQPQLPAPEEV